MQRPCGGEQLAVIKRKKERRCNLSGEAGGTAQTTVSKKLGFLPSVLEALEL